MSQFAKLTVNEEHALKKRDMILRRSLKQGIKDI